MSTNDPQLEERTETDIEEELKEPPQYKVLLLNDDYTTMEFVVQVLMSVFHKSIEESTRIMLKIHHNGIGLCGIYPFEIAEVKVSTVHALAKERGFPLKCTMEKE
jgi:ATP-dependent Clp protease adaptor protein ClpS